MHSIVSGGRSRKDQIPGQGKMMHGSLVFDRRPPRHGRRCVRPAEQLPDECAVPGLDARRPTPSGRSARLAGHRICLVWLAALDPELALALAGPVGRGSSRYAGKGPRRAGSDATAAPATTRTADVPAADPLRNPALRRRDSPVERTGRCEESRTMVRYAAHLADSARLSARILTCVTRPALRVL